MRLRDPLGANKAPEPLFLVGMPRSGTKLLRAILDNHPQVQICPYETKFLPYWIAKWDTFGDLSRTENFDRFFVKNQQFPFFWAWDANCHVDAWYRRCRSFDPAGVFRGLIHTVVDYVPGNIWGDKTPEYLTCIPMLKSVFPDAKFIHIVRDVRDYCLSIHKAWSKNMLRAAQRWYWETMQASDAILGLGKDGIEVRYEDLIAMPEKVSGDLCAFLSIPRDDRMLKFSKPVENYGDTCHDTEICSHNKYKWKRSMDAATVEKIERITAEQLRRYGYEHSYSGPSLRLSAFYLTWLRFLDAVNLLRATSRRHGIMYAWKHHYQTMRLMRHRNH